METGPVYRIAYLGTCHGGNFDLATRMISTAAEFGMQGVVIDLFRAESLAEPGIDSNYARYKTAEFRPSQYEQLADMAGELGMDPIFHPRDLDSLHGLLNKNNSLWTRADSPFAQQTLDLADSGREIYLEGSEPARTEGQGAVLKFPESPVTRRKKVVFMELHAEEIPTHGENSPATLCDDSTEPRPQILTAVVGALGEKARVKDSVSKPVVCQHFYPQPIEQGEWPRVRRRFQYWVNRVRNGCFPTLQYLSKDAA